MKLFCRKQDLMRMCNLIPVITVAYAFTQFIHLILNLINNGLTNFWEVGIMQKNNNALAVIAVSIMFFMLAHNVKRGEIFSEKNEKILRIFGQIVGFIGLIFMCLVIFVEAHPMDSYSAMILTVLLGVVLVFFSLIMQIGRKMREESELTI